MAFFLPQAAAVAWRARQSLGVLSIQTAPIPARLCPCALNASRFAGDAEWHQAGSCDLCWTCQSCSSPLNDNSVMLPSEGFLVVYL